MSFAGSHRSSASLSANQAPPARAPSPFANKLRLNSPAGSLLPPIPPPAPLGLPDMETISLGSMNSKSKPTPIPKRRSQSPLRPQAFDRSMDPEVEEEEEDVWGERTRPSASPSAGAGSPSMARFANTFATRVNSFFGPLEASSSNPGGPMRMTDAELEAEAERAREQSRREAERILTEEAAERRRAEEKALAERAQQRAQAEQNQRMMERAQLGRPVTPTRGMSLSPVTSPGKKEKDKEGEGSWWGLAKSKLTPTREKDKEKEKEKEVLTPAQQIINDARNKEKEKETDKGKKSGDWPALPGVRSTDPTLLAMAAAAAHMSTSPGGSANHFLSGGALSASPSNQRTYSPKPIMPHEQLAREIEAQGGGRVSSDFFGTRMSSDGILSAPKTPLPFASRATPSPAPSPLQPARAQTSPAQMGLSNGGTPLMGRSPNTSPDKSPNGEKDKRLNTLNTLDTEKRTSTSGTTDDGSPPLYAQFTPTGALDIPLTLLTVARRFEKLEKWTVGHVRALEERMKDVERYLVDKDTKSDAVGKEINLLKAGIQDIRRNMENLREAIPPPTSLQPPVTPARPGRVTEVAHDSSTVTSRSRAMSSTSASSYASAISALNGDTSNPTAVRASVISLGSVEADGIEVRPSVAEVVTPIAPRQPLPSVPSLSNSLTASVSSLGLGSPPSSRSFTSPPSGSGSREFKPVPMAAKEFSSPPPLSRVSSLTGEKPTSPPSGLRSRLPYPTGDYTSAGQPVSAIGATAASFPMPPGASSSSLTLSGSTNGTTAPLTIRAVEKEKDKEKEKEKEAVTPLAIPQSRAPRAESVSPTPRKRYTIALSGGNDERERTLPTQTAVFTTSPLTASGSTQTRSPPSGSRIRSQSTYGFPQPPPSPSPSPAVAAGRLRRAVSSSNDGSGGLAAVFAQTEDWEDVREKVLSPRLVNGGESGKFVDPLVVRRKGAAGGVAGANGSGVKAAPGAGAGRGKVPISQLVKFFDGDK
ncbi:hypothetical protein FRC12_005973 [Ceratobasidium sp. 428]|nr:hypothetical protein FRC12_005973 [Ceratobasidium sp. 428]